MQQGLRTGAWSGGKFWGMQIVAVASASYMTNAINITAFASGVSGVTLDWGDGTVETVTATGVKTHTYAAAGEYTVKVSDGVFAMQTFGGGDAAKAAMQYMWKSLHVRTKLGFEIQSGAFRLATVVETATYEGSVTGCSVASATFWSIGLARDVTLTLNVDSVVHLPLNAFDSSSIFLKVPASLISAYQAAGAPYTKAKSIEAI